MTGDTLQTAELQHAFSRIAALEAQLATAQRERDEARDKLLDMITRESIATRKLDKCVSELAKERRLAQWTEITPENLPKEGQIFLGNNGEAERVLCNWDHMYLSGWFIAPPEVKP